MGHPVESSIIKTVETRRGKKKRETFRDEISSSFVWITTII